jgi:hypothetical protein
VVGDTGELFSTTAKAVAQVCMWGRVREDCTRRVAHASGWQPKNMHCHSLTRVQHPDSFPFLTGRDVSNGTYRIDSVRGALQVGPGSVHSRG